MSHDVNLRELYEGFAKGQRVMTDRCNELKRSLESYRQYDPISIAHLAFYVDENFCPWATRVGRLRVWGDPYSCAAVNVTWYMLSNVY